MYIRILFILSLCVCVSDARANHVLGGNITWECLGGNQYEITLTIYKDCFGSTPAPSEETLFFFPSGCGAVPFSLDISFASETEISDLCPSELVNSSCNGGLIPGTQQVVYTEIVTLDPSCTWNIQWFSGDWNYFVNMDNSLLPDAYFSATINPAAVCNQSVEVNSLGVPYFCQGDPVAWQLGIDNPNGYTLSYTLTSVLTTGGVPAPYEAGYSGSSPIPGISVSSTGVITFNAPFIFGAYSVGVLVTMTDSMGNVVGTFLESMAFVVRLCVPTPTDFTAPGIINADNTVQLVSGTEISVCAGESFCFDVEATNSNIFRNITLTTDFTAIFPTGTFTQTGNNPAVGEFCLSTDESMIGTYVIEVEATDDACVQPGYDQLLITINIEPNIEVSVTNATICDGGVLNVTATGANQYQWNVVSGDADPSFSCATCGNQSLSPESNTVIEVIGVGAPAFCNYRDTLTVLVALSDISSSVTNESCAQNDGAIDITVNAGTGAYTYTWNVAPVNAQDQTGLDGGNYNVTISDTGVPGCSVNLPFVVGTTPAPSGTISGNITICEGQSADILFDLTGTGPFVVNMTPAGPGTASDGTIFTVSPLVTTTYTLNSIQDANVPPCTYSVPSSVTVTVRPLVEATFLPVNPICEGDAATLEFDINEPGSYNVQYNPGGPANGISDGATISVSPANSTTYTITSVSYPTAPFCPSVLNNSILLTVNDLPDAVLSGGNEICAGENLDLNIALTGTGPWSIAYTANGVAQPAIVTANTNYILNVSPGVTTTYCLTSVTDQGTTCVHAINSCQTVTVEPVPDATISQDITLCAGDPAPITLDLTSAAGAFNAVLEFTNSQGTTTVPLNNLGDPYVYSYTATETTTATLVSVEYSNNPGDCVTLVNESVTVSVNPDLNVSVTDTVCSTNGTTYQVIFSVTGGDPLTYEDNPVGTVAGVFGAGTYTSGNIPTTAGASWTFTDQYDCAPFNYVMAPYECPIVTYSGTMLSDTVVVCGNGVAAATWNGDGIFDGDDQLMFILHTNSGNTLGTILATDCNDSNFNDPDNPLVLGYSPGPGVIVYGTVYYVSAIVGDDDGSGDCVDLTAPFVSISAGQPVVFYPIPDVTLAGGGTGCEGDVFDVTADFTGLAPWVFEYSIDGVSTSVTTSDDPYVIPANETGTYVAVSISNYGCGGTVAGNAQVTIHPLPTATLDGDAVTCEGVDHVFEIALTGTANWSFDIVYTDDLGASTTTPVAAVGATPYNYAAGDPGTYVVSNLTDGNGCSGNADSAPVTLTVNETPIASFTEADTSFCEGENTELIIDLLGVANWTIEYTVDGGAVQTWTATSSPFSAVIAAPGLYEIVQITDGNGCVDGIAGSQIQVTEIAAPIVNAGPDVAVCSDEPFILGTPAVPGQAYQWSPVSDIDDATLAQPEFQAINPGPGDLEITYTVTASVLQCSSSDDVLITIVAPPQIDAGTADSLCFGGALQLQASGGATYEWLATTDFASNTDIPDPIVQPVQNTWFYVTGYDSFQCVGVDSVFVVVIDEIIADEVFSDALCFGACDGTIEIIPSGGAGTYSISWTDGTLSGLQLSNLCPGDYTYTLQDYYGCDTTGTITLDELPEAFIDDVNVIPASCYGTNTGQIEVLDANGSSYTLVETGEVSATGIFADLIAGTYTVEMTDGDGCVSDTTVSFVASSLEIDLNTTFDEVIVCVDDVVSFEGIAVGGDGTGFIYEWYNCATLDPGCLVGTGSPLDVTITQDTTLYVIAIDGSGCISDTLDASAVFNPSITVNAGPDAEMFICEGECVDLSSGAGGGTGAIDITWVSTDGLSSDTIDTGFTTTQCPMVNTWYIAIGSDGCTPESSDTVFVTVYEMPEAILEVSAAEGCYPVTVELFNLTDPEMLGNCNWQTGDGSELAVCSDFTYTYAFEGSYFPVLSVTSPDGCTDTDTLDVAIEVHGYPIPGFTWEPQPVNTLLTEVQFQNMSEGEISWEWDFGGLGQSEQQNPIFTFPDEDLATFPVCLKVTNEFGCQDSLCQFILMESVLLVYVPNAFTPDNDGTNDVFVPIVRGIDPSEYRLVIYDRWGNQVFESNTVGEVWTGNHMGGDYFVQNDVYVWRLEVKELASGDEKVYKGHVTALR